MRPFTVLHVIVTAMHILIQLALVIRILLRRYREPASRIAWIAVVIAAPFVGIVAYLLLGEVNVGRRFAQHARAVTTGMPRISATPGIDVPEVLPNLSEQHQQLFRVSASINGFQPMGGNSARLMPDSNAAVDSMVADIDHANDHVHLVFYIWLTDHNGRKMAQALIRAAVRGVVCRVLVDDLGSRD